MSALISAIILSASQIALNNLLSDFVTSLENSASAYQLSSQYFSYQNTRMSSSLAVLLKNMTILDLSIGSSSLSLNPSRKIHISLQNITFSISFNWEYSISHLNDNGNSTISIRNGSADFDLFISDSNLLHFSSQNITLDLKDLKIQVQKPSNINQNWFFQMFRPEIETLAENSFSNVISSTVDQLNPGNMYFLTSGGDIGFNYSLTSSPSISAQGMVLKSLGIFVVDLSPNYSPPIPAPQAVDPSLSEGIEMIVSDYVVNSYTYCAYKLGMLDLNITNDTVSQFFPLGLTTTTLGLFFPSLVDSYGLDQPVDIFCAFDEAPLMNLIDNPNWSVEVLLNQTFGCNVFVNKSTALVFDGRLLADSQFYLLNWTVYGKVKTLTVQNVKVTSSAVKVNQQQLESSVNSALTSFKNSVNDNQLKNGIALPKDARFDLNNTKVRSGRGFLLVYMEPRIKFDLSLLGFSIPSVSLNNTFN